MVTTDKFDAMVRLGSKHIGELFQILKGSSEEEIISYLTRYAKLDAARNVALRTVLRGIYDKTVTLDLPPGPPPMTREYTVFGSAPGNLVRSAASLAQFAKGSAAYIQNDIRRQQKFVQFCESLHTDEIEVVLMIKHKEAIPGVSVAQVVAAFPGLIKDPIDEVVREVPNADSGEEPEVSSPPAQQQAKKVSAPRKPKPVQKSGQSE